MLKQPVILSFWYKAVAFFQFFRFIANNEIDEFFSNSINNKPLPKALQHSLLKISSNFVLFFSIIPTCFVLKSDITINFWVWDCILIHSIQWWCIGEKYSVKVLLKCSWNSSSTLCIFKYSIFLSPCYSSVYTIFNKFFTLTFYVSK